MMLHLKQQFGDHVSDISRTFPVNGKFSAAQKKVYEAVLKTNRECIKVRFDSFERCNVPSLLGIHVVSMTEMQGIAQHKS